MWILREPPVAARPRPSQQDLQHLTTPHDCHHLCVTFTAGSRTINGCSCWWASGNQRNMRLCFCPDTMGMYRINPINAFFFAVFFPFVTPVWYFFCPSQKNSGMDRTRISLIWPFLCCISIYWSFILMFGDALKKNQDVWWTTLSDYLGGLFFFTLSFIDCH